MIFSPLSNSAQKRIKLLRQLFFLLRASWWRRGEYWWRQHCRRRRRKRWYHGDDFRWSESRRLLRRLRLSDKGRVGRWRRRSPHHRHLQSQHTRSTTTKSASSLLHRRTENGQRICAVAAKATTTEDNVADSEINHLRLFLFHSSSD